MRSSSAGFTLLELVIAMTVLGLVTVALYGVIALGAAAAGAGERKTEQARRYRTAVTVMARQLHSVAPMYVSTGEDQDPEPYFLADEESVEFVTSAPQGPYAAGLALVRYWVEDGKLLMSELPYFLAYDADGLDKDADALKLEAVLLYDVKSLSLGFQRSESDDKNAKFQDTWDATEEDALPAVVRVSVESETPDGPQFEYEMPVYVGVMNAITGREDFDDKRIRASKASFSRKDRESDDDKAGGKGKPPPDTSDDEDDEDLE